MSDSVGEFTAKLAIVLSVVPVFLVLYIFGVIFLSASALSGGDGDQSSNDRKHLRFQNWSRQQILRRKSILQSIKISTDVDGDGQVDEDDGGQNDHNNQNALPPPVVKVSNRLFVLTINTDRSDSSRHATQQVVDQINQLLVVCKPTDRVLLSIESSGGTITEFGLLYSHCMRLRKKGIEVHACIDRVACSGGYLLAIVAHQIFASPFAEIGSVGVYAQQFDVSSLLQNFGIRSNTFRSGPFKNVGSPFEQMSPDQIEHVKQKLESTHQDFQHMIKEHRPLVPIDEIVSGETWIGKQAITLKLIDGLTTSQEYLLDACDHFEVWMVGETDCEKVNWVNKMLKRILQ